MPGHRQHNQENRHQDRNGTRRPQHPEQAETPKVPGVGPGPWRGEDPRWIRLPVQLCEAIRK